MIIASDFRGSIAKLFRACFCGVSHNYRAICSKKGNRTDVSGVNRKYQGGVSHHFGELLTSLKKYSAIRGIAAIVSHLTKLLIH